MPATKYALASVLLAACVCLAGCQRADPIKVGFIGGLSGRFSDLAIDGRNGVQLALEDVNAAGGVNGRQVELLVQDDKQEALTAQSNVRALAQAKVAFVVGPMTSQMAVSMAKLADSLALDLISPTATTHELSGQADHFFRVVPDAPTGARQQADYLLKRGYRKMATLTDSRNKSYSESWAHAAIQHFTSHGGLSTPGGSFESGSGDLRHLADQALLGQPDVILVVAAAVDAALIATQIRHKDPSVKLVFAPWAGTEQLIQLGGRAIEKALVPQYHDRASTTQAYKAFAARYAKRFGEQPGFAGTNAYDATMIGLDALKRSAAHPIHDTLRQAHEYPGLQRPIMLDANGDSPGKLYLTEVINGQFTPVLN